MSKISRRSPSRTSRAIRLAFPRPGVKKLLENARVIVWDYTWTTGVATPMHFHDKDVVVFYLEDGDLQSTTPKGEKTVNPYKPVYDSIQPARPDPHGNLDPRQTARHHHGTKIDMNFSILASLSIAVCVRNRAGRGRSTCDRACLENFVDQYMDALIAHDPKKLPMTTRVKNTEDGVRLDPGDGFWRTALAKGSYRLFVTDTETGQVAFMGTMREVNTQSNPVIIAIRLKVENRQISEIENIVVRDAPAATIWRTAVRRIPVFGGDSGSPEGIAR